MSCCLGPSFSLDHGQSVDVLPSIATVPPRGLSECELLHTFWNKFEAQCQSPPLRKVIPRPFPSRIYTHWLFLLDHSNCTVYCPIFFVFQAQISPISPFASSYQPCPGIGSVMASQSSCELVDVKASSTDRPPRQPEQPGYGITA